MSAAGETPAGGAAAGPASAVEGARPWPLAPWRPAKPRANEAGGWGWAVLTDDHAPDEAAWLAAGLVIDEADDEQGPASLEIVMLRRSLASPARA